MPLYADDVLLIDFPEPIDDARAQRLAELKLEPLALHGRYFIDQSACSRNIREKHDRKTVLNFENDASVPRPKAVELSDQFGDIFRAPNKGQGDQIPIFGRKLKILTVLLRQGRNLEFGVGQVDAFLCTKFGSALGGVSDFYFELGFAAFFGDRSDDTLNLAVVEKNSLTRPCVSKDFWQ